MQREPKDNCTCVHCAARTPAKVAGVDLDALKATFAKATQGPLIVLNDCAIYRQEMEGGEWPIASTAHSPLAAEDAAAIVALHNAFPALIAKIEADAMRIAALEGALASVKWASADRDNMEFAARITYVQMDAIRAALTPLAAPGGV